MSCCPGASALPCPSIRPNAATAEPTTRGVIAAGRALGLDIRIFNAGANGELAAAFAAFSGWRPEALLALAAGDPLGALKRIVRFPTCCREQMQRTIL